MCYIVIKGNRTMKTKHLTIRIEPEVVDKLDSYAQIKEWTRSYLVAKILKERIYELTGDFR